ncbi:MAG: chloride channel protein [Actinomycetota bacterium]|nr:chloride channel protein [Actinomycetota bacterium]
MTPSDSASTGGGRKAAAGVAFRVRLSRHRVDLFAFGRRGRQVVLLAALTGAVTGLGVAGFEAVTRAGLFDRLLQAPLALQVLAPVAGLVLAAVALRFLAAGASTATADEYIKNFHQPGVRLDVRPVLGRLVASVATLGLGGAMGYEGPSIYLGATVGSVLQRRFSRHFSREDAKVLLVAGAAAGVAAIFKAPATGLVFALEVPYQDDFARRMLLPAGIAAAVSYVVFVSFSGTAPLFAVSGSPPFDLRDLGGAALLGVLCGIGARLFTQALVSAKRLAARTNPIVRAVGAGSVLAALALLAKEVFGMPLTLGAGYDNLTWAFDPRRAVALVLLLLAMRAAATIATVGGGGVGGLFVPLVIEGALLGRAMGGLFRTAASGSHFFPLVGVSAFLGAGYRVPLAGVVFAAEASGRPGFIVPGLIAAMVAQLFMGHASASPYQVAARAGHLERRFALPITAAMRTDVATMAPDTTLSEFFGHHLLANHDKAVAVVDGARYLGVMAIEELQTVPNDQWDHQHVGNHMRIDLPTANPTMSLRDVLALMEDADVDLLPVLDGDSFVGVITTTEILKLDEILDQTGGEG